MHREPTGMMWIRTKPKSEEHREALQFVPVHWETKDRKHPFGGRSSKDDLQRGLDCGIPPQGPTIQPAPIEAEQSKEAQQDADEEMCVLCMERAPDMMLLPCKHRCFCRKCIVETICVAMRPEAPGCPMCRTGFHTMVILE
mmetsp:Transcript_14723/g.40143  ORF Transcript_14723/g.40143 Transcript_14723/m.40143 type:complete len:141 (-) Transcript_14723:103-525(-)